jgi:hypothetical protein
MPKISWQPIEDLPNSWPEMQLALLTFLRPRWEHEKLRIARSDSIKEFNRKLIVRWSIETGILENLYDLNQGITNLLVQKGIRKT